MYCFTIFPMQAKGALQLSARSPKILQSTRSRLDRSAHYRRRSSSICEAGDRKGYEAQILEDMRRLDR